MGSEKNVCLSEIERWTLLKHKVKSTTNLSQSSVAHRRIKKIHSLWHCFLKLFVFNTYIHTDETIALVCGELLNITACVIQNCGCDINTLGENTSEDIYNLDRQTDQHECKSPYDKATDWSKLMDPCRFYRNRSRLNSIRPPQERYFN